MKKIILLMLLIAGIGLYCSEIQDIAIEGGNYTVETGDTLRIYVNAVNLEEDMRVIAFQFDSYYNSELLKYIGHQAGDLFENAMLMANGEEAGIVKVACSHWLPQSGAGTLIELQFIAQQAGETKLQFDKFKMNSSLMQQVYDAEVKIIGKDTKKK